MSHFALNAIYDAMGAMNEAALQLALEVGAQPLPGGTRASRPVRASTLRISIVGLILAP